MAAKNPKNNVTVSVTGAFFATLSAEAGTSLRVALTKAGKTATGFTFADDKGKVVSGDRKLSADLNIVATAIGGTATAAATTTATEAAPAATAAATTTAADESFSTTTGTVATGGAAEAAAAAPATPAAPAAAAPTKFQVNIKGKVEASFQATAGSTLRQALTEAGQPVTGASFSGPDGRAFGLDRKITESVTLSSNARVSGG